METIGKFQRSEGRAAQAAGCPRFGRTYLNILSAMRVQGLNILSARQGHPYESPKTDKFDERGTSLIASLQAF